MSETVDSSGDLEAALGRLKTRVLLTARDDAARALALRTIEDLRKHLETDPEWVAHILDEYQPPS